MRSWDIIHDDGGRTLRALQDSLEGVDLPTGVAVGVLYVLRNVGILGGKQSLTKQSLTMLGSVLFFYFSFENLVA